MVDRYRRQTIKIYSYFARLTTKGQRTCTYTIHKVLKFLKSEANSVKRLFHKFLVKRHCIKKEQLIQKKAYSTKLCQYKLKVILF